MGNGYEFSAGSGVRKKIMKTTVEESEHIGNLTWTVMWLTLGEKTDWIKNKIHPVCKKKVKRKLLILKE